MFPNAHSKAAICGGRWGVYIFHEGSLLHPSVSHGCAPAPRIKCSAALWNGNPAAVSSGNLDWDLNSNIVFFFPFLFSKYKPDPSKKHSALYFHGHTLLNIFSDKRYNPPGK
jgi:hypothetical protein